MIGQKATGDAVPAPWWVVTVQSERIKGHKNGWIQRGYHLRSLGGFFSCERRAKQERNVIHV
jgi:hypothetical protein